MKSEKPFKLQLQVPRNPNEIQGDIKDILKSLSEKIFIGLKLERNLKLIFTELITNSIKHAPDGFSHLQVTIKDSEILIQKTDKGSQIKFTQQLLPFEEVNKVIDVTFPNENNCQIEILDKYRFKFLDPYKMEIRLDHLPEHFGLYIITLASDNFIYEYNPELKENYFIIMLKIGQHLFR
jgi:anti-sigma regulatory factor (Ser/Thr protein kinase)